MAPNVVKGFLTNKKSGGQARAAAVEAADPMQQDTKSYFAFTAPEDANQRELYSVICDHARDLLGDFQLEVIGVCVTEGFCAVGVEYLHSQTSALEAQIYHIRDQFLFKGAALAAVNVDHPNVFTKPVQPAPGAKRSASAAAIEAHDHVQQHRAQAASLTGPPALSPGLQAQPSSLPLQPPGVGAAIPPPAVQQQPVVPPALALRPPGLSPVVQRHKAAFKDFMERKRALPPLNEVPPLPSGGGASAALAPITLALTQLVTDVNEMRSNLLTKQDLAEFRELHLAESEATMATHLVPIHDDLTEIKRGQVFHDDRIGALETRMDRFASSSGTTHSGLDFEKTRMQVLNDNEPAFKQIAFVGFKTSDLDKRMRFLHTYAELNFPSSKVVNVETVMKGPRDKREPTETVVMEFFSRDVRDIVLKKIGDKKAPKITDGATTIELKAIERARTRVQKARNWAMRKAHEMITTELVKVSGAKDLQFDWTMPKRKVLFNGEPVFVQDRERLRGDFVGRFSSLVLPP